MSSNVQPYPHVEINVEDTTIRNIVPVELLPAFRPHFAMITQKGPIGVPVWCPDYSTAAKIFGGLTFDPLNGPYYTNSSTYLRHIFQYSGAFITRVADSQAAQSARLIFELKVETRPDIPRYVEGQTGHRDVDENGDWIPLVEEGSPVLVDGYRLSWMLRTTFLGDETSIDDLAIRNTTVTEDIGGQSTVIPVSFYPMFAIEAANPGVWGNDLAFSFYFDRDVNDAATVDKCGGFFFTMAPVVKQYNSSVTNAVRDIYNNTRINFMFKPNVTDPRTTQQVSVAEVMANKFDTNVPFRIKVYNANFETVGGLVETIENENDPQGDEIDSEWHVNLFTGMHPDGRYYDYVEVVRDTEIPNLADMRVDTYQYLEEGDDGSLDDEDIEVMLGQFYTLATNPDIVDQARYPFNYIFDTGYTYALKQTLLDFMSIRDDVRVSVSTQDVAMAANGPDVDESMGLSLRAYALLMRESVLKGTEACRASIWAHCGIPLIGNNKIVPANLWDALKHAQYHSLSTLDEEPAGLPNALVEIFKAGTINWVPSAEQTRSRFWNTGINYMQYANMTQLHYPATRSVYPHETSVLVKNVFVDAVVYAKQLVRTTWAEFSDVQAPFEVLSSMITDRLTSRIGSLFNGKYPFTIVVYQTEEEKLMGFVGHVRLEITSPANFRVWVVDIVCRRENYEVQ